MSDTERSSNSVTPYSSSDSESDHESNNIWQDRGDVWDSMNGKYTIVSPPPSPRDNSGGNLLNSLASARARKFVPTNNELLVKNTPPVNTGNVNLHICVPECIQNFIDNLSPLLKAFTQNLKKERDYITPLKSAGMGMFYILAIFVATVSLVYFMHSIELATDSTSLAEFAFVWKNMFAFVVYHLCKNVCRLTDRTSSVIFVLLIMAGHYIPDLELIKYSNHKDVDNLPILEEFDKAVFKINSDFHGLSMFNDLFATRTACALNFSQFDVSSSLTTRCFDTLNNIFDIFDTIYLPAFMEITLNSEFSFPPEIYSEVHFVIQGNQTVETIVENYRYNEVVKSDLNVNACFNESVNCEKFLQMMCFFDRRMLNGHVYRNYYKPAKIIAKAAQIVAEKTIDLHDQLDEIPYGNTVTTFISSQWVYGAFIRDSIKLWGKLKGYLANYDMIVSLMNVWGNREKLTEYVHPATVPKMQSMLGSKYLVWVNETFSVNKLVRQYNGRQLHAPNITRLQLTAGTVIFNGLKTHNYQKFIHGLKKRHFKGCPFQNLDDGVKLIKGCPALAPVCVNVVEGHVFNQLETIKVNCKNRRELVYVNQYMSPANNNSINVFHGTDLSKLCKPCEPCKPCICQSANLSCPVSEPCEKQQYTKDMCRFVLGLGEEDRSLGFADANEYLKHTVAVSVVRASPLIIGIFRGLNRHPLKHRAILSAFVLLNTWNWYDEISAVQKFIKKSLYTAANSTVGFVRGLVRAGTPMIIGGTIMGGIVYINVCQAPIDMSWRGRVTDWKKQVMEWLSPLPDAVRRAHGPGDAATILLGDHSSGQIATMHLDGGTATTRLGAEPATLPLEGAAVVATVRLEEAVVHTRRSRWDRD